MKVITAIVFTTLYIRAFGFVNHEHDKVICYWNSTSFERQGPAKFDIDDLRPALILCTHLVYGYVGINAETFNAVSLHPKIDTVLFKVLPQLKRFYPNLKIYLSVGGNDDPDEEIRKYLLVTETNEARARFTSSVVRFLTDYEFDGIDLAWQFPQIKVEKPRGTFSSMWRSFKNFLGYGEFKDTQEAKHRDGFTILVRNITNQLRRIRKDLTISVLPHVNTSVYYDVRSLAPIIDVVNILAYDQNTPQRNPKSADYTAPIYSSYGRPANENIDNNVRFWLEHGMPGSKIVVGIPTYARTWKLTADSKISGVPPVVADGPGAEGPYTVTPGLLSYTEVCTRLAEISFGPFRRITDPLKKYGTYGYQLYNFRTGVEGIWMSYEDPDAAENKAAYVRSKALGGVAIVDISLDDFRGICSAQKFPIVRAAKWKL